MTDLSKFQQYYELADRMIQDATKEDLAACARLLALNLAHYQEKFGEMPLEDTLLSSRQLSPTMSKLCC